MSELISGKEALIALANGQDVLYIDLTYQNQPNKSWGNAKDVEVGDFLNDIWVFKLKPRTIKINGVDTPAPFKPKDGEDFYYINFVHEKGYSWGKMQYDTPSWFFENLVWRTEEEIKQVVAALRSVFNESS